MLRLEKDLLQKKEGEPRFPRNCDEDSPCIKIMNKRQFERFTLIAGFPMFGRRVAVSLDIMKNSVESIVGRFQVEYHLSYLTVIEFFRSLHSTQCGQPF